MYVFVCMCVSVYVYVHVQLPWMRADKQQSSHILDSLEVGGDVRKRHSICAPQFYDPSHFMTNGNRRHSTFSYISVIV